MISLTPISEKEKFEARERVAKASEESRSLARDAIFDRALQEALLEEPKLFTAIPCNPRRDS